MKLSFYFCTALLVVAPLAASARPKRMGPSAIQAARLKQNPPPNYLAHYLPDDRYKIAGGVWKYVTTDLDTYYHLPSSPNMLRQPASRVIGFANAKDAEEAGYEPDPTDGTSARVSSLDLPTGPGSGLTLEDGTYMIRVGTLMGESLKDADRVIDQIEKFKNNQSNGGANMVSLLSQYRPFATRNLQTVRRSFAAFNRLKPPAKFRQAHAHFRSAFNQLLISAVALDKFFQTPNDGYLALFTTGLARSVDYQKRGNQALKAAGANIKDR